MTDAEVNQRVTVTANVSDSVLARPSFSTLAILAKHGNLGIDRVTTYTSLTAVNAVFASYTPVGVAAGLFFGQARVPNIFKVIFRGDAETVATAMAAALLVDEDFYFIGSADRDNTSITDLQDWAQTNSRLNPFSTEDATAPTAGTSDPIYYGFNLSYNRAAGYFKRNAGFDLVVDDITVVSTTATATTTGAHGVEVGDIVYVWDTTSTGSLGKHTVLTTPLTTTFTFAVAAGTTNDAAGSIKVLVSGQMLEFGLIGLMASTEPGRRTWDLQTVAGVGADKLTDGEKGFITDKNGNYYNSLGGTPITSGLKANGFGGKLLTNRNIDLQWFLDWFLTNVQLDVAQVLINAGGELGFDAPGVQKVQAAIESRCQQSLDNGAITTFVSGPYIGRNFVVTMPELGAITSTDRQNGLLGNIVVDMFFKSKIKGVEIEINLSV